MSVASGRLNSGRINEHSGYRNRHDGVRDRTRTSAGAERTLILDDDRRHTESLMPGIRELLATSNLSPHDVERVVVDRGPGLYTGLRVGIATAIGFALAAQCDLVGVTSLELLAAGAYRGGARGVLVAAVDGRRGEVFVQSFELSEEVAATSEPRVARPADVIDAWQGRDLTITGDGVRRYEREFGTLSGATFFDQPVPPTREALALGAIRAPEVAITPMYLREADAVANFTTRERSS